MPILSEIKLKSKTKIIATPYEASIITGRKYEYPKNKQVMIYEPCIETFGYSGKYERVGLCPLKGWEGDQYLKYHNGINLIN